MVDLGNAEHIFNTLYGDINGYLVSSQARQKLSYHDKSHTYGEIAFKSFNQIISKADPQPGDVFYDLGSGTGKAVILASMLFPFKKCVGVEILEDLYNSAETMRKRYEGEFRTHLSNMPENQTIEFLNTDFLTVDMSDANIVFAHSTCFYDELWEKLVRRFELLKPGTKVVTVTKHAQSPMLRLLDTREYAMGWGNATVYFYNVVTL